ncbi:MAG: peroxide stress protein YaaA [Rubricella sp.]
MLVVISPAKNLDFSEAPAALDLTAPVFRDEANALAAEMRKLPVSRIKAMMALSDRLADLNWQRFQAWSDDPAKGTVKQAALAFAGDTYRGLQFASLSPDAVDRAQDHLRILSGLYGLLRPLDAIQPYRLEMGRKVHTARGGTLYDWWGDTIARALEAQAATLGTGTLVNLASKEYFGAVERGAPALDVVTPQFLEEKDGARRMISFHAKTARGAMARWIIENRPSGIDELRGFDWAGYRFDPGAGDGATPVFVRSAARAAA